MSTKSGKEREQSKVNSYFAAESSYWDQVYSLGDVQGEIYRDRALAVLAWIDLLALPPGSRVLDAGCGAGMLSIAMAERGLRVQAIDAVDAMVALARRNAEHVQLEGNLAIDLGNVSALAFGDDTFDLVVALGVIPWLEQPASAVHEMARVTRQGGHVILTADNRSRLNHLLDPRFHPALTPIREGIKAALERSGRRAGRQLPDAIGRFDSRRFVDTLVRDAGLVPEQRRTLGFGPFTFLGRRVLPDEVGQGLHRRLQRLADTGTPIVRGTGSHYLLSARKP